MRLGWFRAIDIHLIYLYIFYIVYIFIYCPYSTECVVSKDDIHQKAKQPPLIIDQLDLTLLALIEQQTVLDRCF
jgi:hypothetical protein